MADNNDFINNDYIEDPTADEFANDTIIPLEFDGVTHDFELLSVEDYNDEQFAVLCPVESFEGFSDDEVLIFKLIPAEDENADDQLEIVEDDDVIQAVFDIFSENYYGGADAFECDGACDGCANKDQCDGADKDDDEE